MLIHNADHLYKRVRKGDRSLPPLSWVQRLKICIGAARGLDYLHTGTGIQHRVIHRDVKTSYILLDENFAAKISDFGLSKISPANQATTTVSVSTHVKGTFGYLDPYYFSTRRLTWRSDVYSFGVVLFEVLCGRPAMDTTLDEEQIALAGWAKHCFSQGLLDRIIDPGIKGEVCSDSLEAFVKVAIACIQTGPNHRPTMAEIVIGLNSALALQEKNTDIAEKITGKQDEDVDSKMTTSDDSQDEIDLSKLELEHESSKKGHMFQKVPTINFLRERFPAKLLSVGPAKEPTMKKEDGKKDEIMEFENESISFKVFPVKLNDLESSRPFHDPEVSIKSSSASRKNILSSFMYLYFFLFNTKLMARL